MSQARGFIGAGDIFINRLDPATNQPTGWVYAGDSSKFEIKPNSEIKERESKGRDSYGQVVETVAIGKPADLSITFAEVNKDNLTLAFMGELTSVNQASGSVTDALITMKAGAGVQLAFGNVAAAGFVLTSSPAGTTYALGTDYTVNYRLGIVFPVAGSSLATAIAGAGAAGLPLLVDYTYSAYTASKIRGATQPQLRAALKFDGKNIADGLPAIVEVFEAVLTPQSAFDFLQDDWNDVELQGRMKTPIGKTEPFTVELRDA